MASVKYRITGKADTKGINDAKKGLLGLGKVANQVNTIFKGFIALKAVSIIKRQVTESLQAYQTQQKAISGLTQAINNNVKLTTSSLKNLITYTSKLQDTSIYGDEMLQEQATLLASMGLTEEKIKDVLKAAVELSSAGVGTLESNVKNLSKTLNGQKGELGELIPEFRDLNEEQLKAGEGVDIVLKKYEGFAENLALDTLEGQVTQLNNKLGDFKEALGSAFAPIASPFYRFVNTIISKWTEAINEMTRYRKLSRLGEERTIQEDLELTIMNIDRIEEDVQKAVEGGMNIIGTSFEEWIKKPGIVKLHTGTGTVDRNDTAQMTTLYKKYDSLVRAVEEKANSEYGSELPELKKQEAELQKQLKQLQKEEADLAKALSENTTSTDVNTDSKNTETKPENDPYKYGFGTSGFEGPFFAGPWSNNPVHTQGSDEWLNRPTPSLTGGKGDVQTPDFTFMENLSFVISDITSGIGDFIGSIMGGIKAFSSVTMIIEWSGTILKGILQVLQPIIDSMLKPFIGFLTIIGQSIGKVIAPLLKMLEPVLTILTKALIWVYNYGIRPFGNALIWIITQINNGIAYAINGIIKGINKMIPGKKWDIKWRMSTMDYEDQKLEKIDEGDLNSAGDEAYGSSSQSSGASYTGQRDINVNIYYNNSYVNGDAREIALGIKAELELAGALGY